MNREYKLTWDVKTTPFANGIIEQETTDIFNQTIKKVVNTQEEQIKQSLITLGWLPPEYIKNVQDRVIKNKDIMEDKTVDGSYVVPFDNRFAVLHIIEDEAKKFKSLGKTAKQYDTEMKDHIKDIQNELKPNTVNEFYGIRLEDYTKEELIVIISWMGKRMRLK